jgi:hypothetical protein
MGLTMNEKKAVARETAKRYQKAPKKQKGIILSEFAAITGYHRTYASWLLRNLGRKVFLKVKGKESIKVVGEIKKTQRKRARYYDEKTLRILRSIWEVSDYLCGKRLVSFIKETLPALEKFGELKLDADTRKKLLKISPATIDRELKKDKNKHTLKSRARTKPGTLLKHQIPIRTFSEWNDKRPGFAEIDLVGHDGGDASGEFAYTLDLTDVSSGWTETMAVRNRAQKWVFEALMECEQRLPFKLLGLDSDNDSAFINDHLLRYCNERQITFTRSRPYKYNFHEATSNHFV